MHNAPTEDVSEVKPSEWNQRFVAFAKSQGKKPEELRGVAMEFMLWCQAKWREWARLNGKGESASRSQADHDSFDAWLTSAFCAQCGSTPCSCHLCSECGDELAGGAGGRCLNCNPLHSRECRCEECSDDNDVAYNAWKDGQL
jgi:hypothetical protein